MISWKTFDRRARPLVVAVSLLLAVIVPTFASAEQLTERSVELSSSSAAATGVTYHVKFTSVEAAAAVVLDFCENSPLFGAPCDAPDGFDASSATSPTAGYTAGALTVPADNTVVVTTAIGAAEAVDFELEDVVNPDNAGPLYVRMVTYDTVPNAEAYAPATPGTGVVDNAGAAVSITPTIGVSAAVLETLTFCVSKALPTAACTGTTAPTLELGELVGTVRALQPGTVSTGSLYTQISTNAASGAIVSLKSSATDCGGLMLRGADPEDACNILPATNLGVDINAAKFGVKTSTATNATGGSAANGTFQPKAGTYYNNSTYALNYVSGNATGITSTYGDPFLDTDGAPANNKNMELVFAATVTNDTPAGLYATDLSMIATGKF